MAAQLSRSGHRLAIDQTALKFTMRGSVHLNVFVPDPQTSGPKWIGFDIEDTGVGIAPEHHEVIFQPFRQADGTTNRRFGGTGLGLSISRELAAMLGGRIELRSELGCGSTFTLLLPPTIPPADPTNERPSAPSPIARRARAPARRPAAAPQAAPLATTAPRQDQRVLLIVEDDPGFAATIATVATGLRFESMIAATADEGIEMALRHRPTAIVLDMRLPDHTGLAVLDRLKHDPVTRHIPIQVISGFDYSQAALEMGATSVIKGARSPERLLDEVMLFLHHVEASLPAEQQRMLHAARSRDSVFEGRRILLVEDDVRNVFAITRVLEPHGAILEIARNGREALAVLDRNPDIELVLMDIMMPEMDGLEAMRKVRSNAAFANLPITALTAKAMPDDRQESLDAGANDYITKPIDIDKLLSLLRIWLPQRKGS